MIRQLQLENPFLEGVNSLYLLDEDDPITLIDTGVSTPETLRSLESMLEDEGVHLEDIDQILLTHWHTDHAALAGDVQARSGAVVRAHEADAGLAGQHDDTWDRMYQTFDEAFDEWDMTADEQALSLGYVDNRDEYWGPPTDIDTFDDERTFEAGGMTLRAVNLPGHTLGSVCYAREDGDDIFTGDTLLPGYTPNIGGGEFRRMESLLEEYLSSLRRFLDWEFETAWPGHRGAISEPSVRARETIQHHWDRLSRILGIIRNYEITGVRTLADHLFGTLEEIHVFIGCAEADIHLKWLSKHDIVSETVDGYVVEPDADRTLDEQFHRLLE